MKVRCNSNFILCIYLGKMYCKKTMENHCPHLGLFTFPVCSNQV